MAVGTLRPDPDVVARRLDDEIVLVNLRTNRIYSLNRTGGRFWDLLLEGHDLSKIEELMTQQFDVGAEELTAEVEALVGRLLSAGLVRHAE
jgi:hypothetical protein